MRINYNPPDVLSSDDRSSKGISPGGRKPLLNFSITSAESWNRDHDDYDYTSSRTEPAGRIATSERVERRKREIILRPHGYF